MAALAGQARKTAWQEDDDGLADDVATLSYERTLRTHARYKAPELSNETFTQSDQPLTQPVDLDVLRFCEAIPDEESLDRTKAAPEIQPASLVTAKITPCNSTDHDRNLKSASITIRLSRAECEQLRSRAADAGLTVSAYMRSCTFEAESLRALVKDTLAQLRTEPLPASQPVPNAARRNWRQWLTSLWPHARPAQSIVQA